MAIGTREGLNKQIIEKVNDAFAKNDVETFLSYCAEDFVFGMVGSDPVKGKDAIRKWMANGPADPPQFSVDTVIADGDYVSAIGNMTMKENGADVAYAYCDVWRFKGDKLSELNAFVIKTQR
jgi:ketosteroid isomerase-like protein